MLSDVEGQAAGIIRDLSDGKFPLSEEDRWTFAYYMALQSVRGPDTRKTNESIRATMIRMEVGLGGRENVRAWTRANLGFDPDQQEQERIWNEATQAGGPPIGFSNLEHIKYAVQTALDLTSYMVTRPWVLIRFTRRSLISSDSPVSLVRHPTDDQWDGAGFATARGIAFPLTRKLGLLMSDPMVMLEGIEASDPHIQKIRAMVLEGRVDHVEAGTTALEKLFNLHTAWSAREYVFYHPDDERFVPSDLPQPDLINVKAQGGIADIDFTTAPDAGAGLL